MQIQLLTRDGSKIGNAIWLDQVESQHTPGLMINLIETDFGNRVRLTDAEVDEWFTIGRFTSVRRWRDDRAALIFRNQ